MSDFKENIIENLKDVHNEKTINIFKSLIKFIDDTLSEGYKLEGDNRAQFLVTNIINLRSFMASEIDKSITKKALLESVLKLYDSLEFSKDLEAISDDLDQASEGKNKKKENDLEDELPLPENLLETDQ